jgi:long-chain fatty acid transport protein
MKILSKLALKPQKTAVSRLSAFGRLSLVGIGFVLCVAHPAQAGGLDKAGLGVGLLFEKESTVELSFAHAVPQVRATPDDFGNIARKYNMLSFGLKKNLDDHLSLNLFVNQPYGLKIGLDVGGPSDKYIVGAEVYSTATSAILRYKINDYFAFHGGGYVVDIGGKLSADTTADLGSASGSGYIFGASVEYPKIAARLALTYFSGTKHNFAGTLDAAFQAPPSINLDFQTGVAQNTLLFGSVRRGQWSKAKFSILDFPLVKWKRTTNDYTLGLGRRFNENWSGAVMVNYAPAVTNENSFSFSPTNGSISYGLAAVYTRNKWKISVGAQSVKLGDNRTLEPLVSWKGNTAFGAGFKIAYTF